MQNDLVSECMFSRIRDAEQVVGGIYLIARYEVRQPVLTLDISTTREEPSFTNQYSENGLGMFVQLAQRADNIEYQVATKCIERFRTVQLLFNLVTKNSRSDSWSMRP